MNTPLSLEIAKLLKEKGFDEPCRFVHDNWNNIEDWYDIDREYHKNSEKNASVYYSAPTIAEVVMWLYEKHGIWVYTSKPSEEGWVIHWQGLDNYPPLQYYNSPTEAYEAAITYTLNNLI